MLLQPHPGLIIWTIITFAVVLVILKAFVWRPLLGALEAREQRISDAIESAEKARDEAQATLAEHQQRLEGAGEEARQIVAQAREAGEKTQQRIVEQARRSIETEKQAALSELRREVGNLAVEAAGQILDANLDDEKNRKLVDDLIAGIPGSN